MFVRKFCYQLLFTLSVVLCLQSELFAQSRLSVRPAGFTVDKNIEGKIDFWKLIFSKYGANQLVFHNRQQPQIIYSVLDLSDINKSYFGKELSRKTKDAIDEEEKRIRGILSRLADGKDPQDPYERRILHLFKALPGRLSSNLAEALEENNIRNQKGIRELFQRGVERSGRYLHAIERVFMREGVPLEVTRLPLVESSFDYTAYSSVGAAGIWQFMRGTGKKYMRIDNLMDERRDPITASRAAAKYLSAAYERIGAWPLAITSYNHGVAGVLKAVNQTGSRSLGEIVQRYQSESFGFASKNFYAEFMAALEVEQNAAKYFPDLQREAPWYFDEVRLVRSIGLSQVAKITSTPVDNLIELNKAFLAPITSGRANIPAGTVIKVPPAKGELLIEAAGGGDMVKFEDELVLPPKSASKKPERSERSNSKAKPFAAKSEAPAEVVKDNKAKTPKVKDARIKEPKSGTSSAGTSAEKKQKKKTK